MNPAIETSRSTNPTGPDGPAPGADPCARPRSKGADGSSPRRQPCRCDRLVPAGIDRGVLDPDDPRWARQRGVTLPIETTTIEREARELDLTVAVADVYRTDPSFAAPEALSGRAGAVDAHPAGRVVTTVDRGR